MHSCYTALIRRVAKLVRQRRRAAKLHAKETETAIMSGCKDAADDVLLHRRGLHFPTASWRSFPSSCAACTAVFEPENVPERVTGEAAEILSDAEAAAKWRRRHLGVRQELWSGEALRERTLCLKSGFCRCQGTGRRVNALHSKLQKFLRHDVTLEREIVDGLIVLQFQGLHLGGDGQTAKRPRYSEASSRSSASSSVAVDEEETIFAFIPHLNLSPWRPVFARMELLGTKEPRLLRPPSVSVCELDDNPVPPLHNADLDAQGLWLKCQSLSGRPWFCTIWELLSEFDLTWQWWVQPWKLSQRPRPVTQLGNEVRVFRSQTQPAARIWLPTKQLQGRPHGCAGGANLEGRGAQDLLDQEWRGAGDNSENQSQADWDNSDAEAEDEDLAGDEEGEAAQSSGPLAEFLAAAAVQQEPHEAHGAQLRSSSTSSSSTSSTSSSSTSSAASSARPDARPAQATSLEPQLDAAPRQDAARDPEAERQRHESLVVRRIAGGPNIGLIRHQPQARSFFALCPRHPGCIKTRTYNEGRHPGSGRPLGYLAAWLRVAEEHGEKSTHMAAKPAHSVRVAARAQLAAEWNSEMFMALERGLRPNEADEPLDVP